MTSKLDKETGARKLIEALRSSPNKVIEIAALSYALGLEAGADLKTKGPAA